MMLYLLTSLVVALSPGPGMVYVISRGLTQGRHAGFIAALGTTSGITVPIVGVFFGLSILLRTSAMAFNLIKYAGAAYLIGMAWITLKAGRSPVRMGTHPSSPDRVAMVFWKGFLINALNPKLSLFFGAFFPQFITQGHPYVPAQTALLGAIFMAITLIVFSVYGFSSASCRYIVVHRPTMMTIIRWVSAGMFTALGIRLAMEHR